MSNKDPVAGGCGFGLRLGIATPKAHPLGRITRIGGITRVTIALDIPPVVALDDTNIADLRGIIVGGGHSGDL